MSGTSGSVVLVYLVLLVAVMYFIMVRPQQKRVAAHRRLVETLEVGDKVVTIGGLHGEIKSVDDDTVELEVAEDTVLKFAKSAIAAKLTGGKAEGESK